jgi:hypothetical protein
MWVTGIVLFVAGGVPAHVGLGYFLDAALSPCRVFLEAASPGPAAMGIGGHLRAHARGAPGGERIGTARSPLISCQTPEAEFGGALLAGGMSLSAAGIALFLVGNAKVRKRPDPLVPDVRVGAGEATLHWTF